MTSFVISSKNQIVVPRQVRESLGIKPGQRLYIKNIGKHSFTISTESAADKYYGVFKDKWAVDPVDYQRSVRQERSPL